MSGINYNIVGFLNLEHAKCRTTSGPSPNVPCIFPFKFELHVEDDSYKEYHDECIEDQDGLWCSTKVDEDGYHISGSNNWGICGSRCPGIHAQRGIYCM